MRNEMQVTPTVFAVFGGGGDLAWRKLTPALFNLHLDKSLPESFAVMGLDRAESSDEEFRHHLREGVKQFSRRGAGTDTDWDSFAGCIHYLRAGSVLMPILEVWAANPPSDFPNYAAGTWGPEAAEALVAQDGRSWILPTILEDQEEDPKP